MDSITLARPNSHRAIMLASMWQTPVVLASVTAPAMAALLEHANPADGLDEPGCGGVFRPSGLPCFYFEVPDPI